MNGSDHETLARKRVLGSENGNDEGMGSGIYQEAISSVGGHIHGPLAWMMEGAVVVGLHNGSPWSQIKSIGLPPVNVHF